MSGHSKWATIKRQKAVTDSKRGALFTKLGNNIAIAARGGADPDTNFTLRLAVDKARAANMPTANIQRSIDRGSGKLGGDQIQEVLYEGYGPGGVAILVECATDNLNRTYPEVKLAFSKHGGNIAEKGAVAFQFERKGMIRVKGKGDDLLLAAIDAGADDVQEEDDDGSIIYTDPKKLAEVRNNLQKADVEIEEAELTFIPKQTITITDKNTAGKIIRLMDALDDNEDVTATHVNFDIPGGITWTIKLKSRRILGIDPGTGILGFGVIDVDPKGKLSIVDAGVIRTPAKQADSDRLLTIFDELKEIIEENKPEIMSVEKLFFAQNVTTAMSVSQARGVVLLLGKQARMDLFEYTPLQIKQALTGYGRATKQQIQEMVRVILGLKEQPKPDDCADALAAAICHSMTMR